MKRLLMAAVIALLAFPTAAPTASAIDKGEARGRKVEYQVYDGYFESNKSGLKGETSFLVFTDPKQFDRVFGKAVVMRKKQHFLPKDAFEFQMVATVIHRGSAVWSYEVEGVTADGGTLTVRYRATSRDGGRATFASPLILSVPKGDYSSVVFIENGKKAGTAMVGK